MIGNAVRRDPGGALLVLALVLAAALYAPTLGRGFVNHDDYWLVRDNPVVQDPSWASVATICCDLDPIHRFVLTPEYLPIRDLSVMLDYAIWGDWIGGFHLTNLIIYLGAIAVWFAALVRFGLDRRIVGLAALLWALHPAHAESVAWLSERKGLLGMLFAGGCSLGYAAFRRGGRTRWLVLAAACAPCAVWSKALAAFALAALAGLELALPALRVAWRRSLAGLAAIAVAGGLAFVPVVILASESSVIGTAMRAPASRAAMFVGTHGFYLRMAAATMANAVSYPIALEGPSWLDLVLGAAGLAALVGAVALRRKMPAEPRAAAVLWCVGFLPISHLVVPLQMVFVADRYLLFPTLGFALAMAACVMAIPRARLRVALAAALALAAGARSLDAQASWRDSRALWQRAVASNPGDGDAWSMYAAALVDTGDRAEADAVVSRALEHARSPRLVLRAALLAGARGDRAAATSLTEEAALGGEPRAMANLAELRFEAGRSDEARAWAHRASDAAPFYANAFRIRGKVALARGEHDDALAAFERAYQLQPFDCVNRFNLALALLALQRFAEARPHLEACIVDPVLGDRARRLLEGAR